jgi:DNA gyrase/topoisomerase IV subunit A
MKYNKESTKMEISKLFTRWFPKQNKVLKEEINALIKQNEDLRIDNEVLNEEINTYKNKVDGIKNGKLILINEEEKKKLEKEVEKIEKAYDLLQDMLSEEENMSGICYDGLSDYYYERYYTTIKAFKNALKDNFQLNIKLPSVEEIERTNKIQENKLTEDAIKLGRYS